jgi:uncharacterized repeat protein (TIGR03803 family)
MVGKRQYATASALMLAMFSALLLVAALPALAQTEIVLHSFTGEPDGANPASSLAYDGKGNFYGTTVSGGLHNGGTVFELSPNDNGGWNETLTYSFCSRGGDKCSDGAAPYSSLIFDSLGNLYATASGGGAHGYGVVFELISAGGKWKEKVLYSFAGGTDGANPLAGLIMDTAGNLYGTTPNGGTETGTGTGTVFELSPSGGGWTEQVIYDLNITTCGIRPNAAGLAMDHTGNIFGAVSSIAFELSPNGDGGWNPAVIHTFSGPPDGACAVGTVVLSSTGNLYGATYSGGRKGNGVIYRLLLEKKGWSEDILHSFGGKGDGLNPGAGIVFDQEGNIYGTTIFGGGLPGYGAIFELVALGEGSYKEKVLLNFPGGENPMLGSLILDSAGDLYGTGYGVVPGLSGAVFELTP